MLTNKNAFAIVNAYSKDHRLPRRINAMRDKIKSGAGEISANYFSCDVGGNVDFLFLCLYKNNPPKFAFETNSNEGRVFHY